MPARFRPRDRVWQCHRGEIRTRHEAALRESGERTWPVAYLLMCKSIAHARGVGAAARLDIARKFTSGDWESFPHGSSARSLPIALRREELRQDCFADFLDSERVCA